MKIQAKKPIPINWAEVEAKHGCGLTSGDQSHDLRVFQVRNFEFDNRKAEALCLIEDTAPLQYVRTLIERGHIHKAHEFLQSLKESDSGLANDAEYLIETCRVKAFLGQWIEATIDCTRVMELQVAPITRMTVLQTRSVAYYETGQWQLSLKDIELIRSFAKLFPESYSNFYAEVLAIKIESSFGDPAKASRLLANLWLTHLSSSSMNQDRLLTLFRLEGHVLRAQGRCSLWASYATMLLSNIIGDDQYAAFARLELFCSGVTSVALQMQIEQDRQNIPLVNLLLSERETGAATFTTSKMLASTICSLELLEEFKLDTESETTSILVVSKYRTVIKLEPFQVIFVPKKSRQFDALLKLLDNKPLSKADLFEKVFCQKYVSHLHDSTIYQLVRRVRQQFKVPLQLVDDAISIPMLLHIKL